MASLERLFFNSVVSHSCSVAFNHGCMAIKASRSCKNRIPERIDSISDKGMALVGIRLKSSWLF